jgi:hypothetical protein
MAGPGKNKPPISKSKVILVEGQDEVHVFLALLKKEELQAEIEVREMAGRRNLSRAVKTVTDDPGWKEFGQSLGIVLDADNDSEGSFQSACTALRGAGLPEPSNHLAPARSSTHPQTSVLIVPPGRQCGMLEDVFLFSVANDPAMTCVDEFFGCLARVLPEMPRPTSKALLRAFLTSWEILEESHWDFVAARLPDWISQMPIAPSAEKVHAFLASRPKPTLNLGTSLSKDEGYWNLDHPAFGELRAFLRSL